MIKISHIYIWKWVQKYKPKKVLQRGLRFIDIKQKGKIEIHNYPQERKNE